MRHLSNSSDVVADLFEFGAELEAADPGHHLLFEDLFELIEVPVEVLNGGGMGGG